MTTGNNSVLCSGGPAAEPNACAANGFLTGYNAGSGYDLGSGLGSMDVTQLVQNWSKVTFQPTTHLADGERLNQPGQYHARQLGQHRRHGHQLRRHTHRRCCAGCQRQPPAAAAVQGTVASPSILTLTNGTATNPAYTYLPGGSYSLVANYGRRRHIRAEHLHASHQRHGQPRGEYARVYLFRSSLQAPDRAQPSPAFLTAPMFPSRLSHSQPRKFPTWAR